MLWVILSIISYFLSAIANVFDKYIVTGTKIKPIRYTFFSGIFQMLYIFLVPFFGFSFPDKNYITFVGILDGILFIFTLLVFYEALKAGEASRVIPVVGVSIPIFTASLAYILFDENLHGLQFISFCFLVFGGALISSRFEHGKIYAIKGLVLSVFAGFLFAVYYTLLKLVYINTVFFSGFLLVQIGGTIGATMILISKNNRNSIFISKLSNRIGDRSGVLFIFTKILAAAAALILNYAISIPGSKIMLINSLQAVQYVFLLALAVFFAKKMPSVINEQFGKNIVLQKTISVALISIGLYFLAL